ncbi:uncharacterized protein LOC119696004 isoform X2 [Motacilla alba alba]|uniref:uncharacterized protein LOC119696004 isoform X2 n=1 Tax=Motacilla alba alba TaxID=1094192 RepID=UPI0018D5305A|nr:uncharacterized protein LOC119696004 isoform X2 [Motacilla alba alba]
MAARAVPSSGGAAESPEPPGACGHTTAPPRAAGCRGGRLSRPGLRFPWLLPGPHMLGAAPGAARRGSRGSPRAGSRRFPVQLPARFPAGHPPGAAPGSARPSPAAGPGPSDRGTAAPAGSMPRGRAWTQEEVSRLLSLVVESGEAALLMASTSRSNEALWRQISHGLAAAGYRRSVAQCRSKWKALKQAFHSERETYRRAELHSPRLPPHYRAMKRIWEAAGRPVFGERRMALAVKLPFGRRRSAPATRSPSSPEPPEHDVGGDTPSTMLSPILQRVKDEPESPGGERIAGVPPTPPAMPHTSCCFFPLSLLGCHTDLKLEGAEGKASFPGGTSLGMGRGNEVLPLAAAATGSHGTAAMSEQPGAGDDASDTSLHGSGMAGLLQNVQQLLVQILQTSRQQQALLESLARDTISYLQLLSHSLVQVGETLHQLLLQPQTHPHPLGHCVPQVPLLGGGSGVPCSPGAPQVSLAHKEGLQLSPDARCIPR